MRPTLQEIAVPELPEVESIRRQLVGELIGRRITAAWADGHPQARQSRVADAVGARIDDVHRRGKYLVCPLTTGTLPPRELILHLGMTGSLRLDVAGTGDPYDRAWLAFDDGRLLRFRDPRRFGRLSIVDAGEYATTVPTLAVLGPEPLTGEFRPEVFARRLAATRAPVKAALLGQRLVAGVGNIYADEALWRSRLHPASRRVGAARAHRLHTAIVEVLSEAIEREGTTFRDYQMVNGQSGRNADFLDVYGRAGLPCPTCGSTLRRTLVAQRSTTYCPSCQRP